MDRSWIWLVDLERTCALFMGQCLGGMLIGEPPTKPELLCQNWLQKDLFSHGLETNEVDYIFVKNICNYIQSSDKEKLVNLISKSNLEVQKYCHLILKSTNLGTEDTTSNEDNFHDLVLEKLVAENWDGFEEFKEQKVIIIMRIFITVLLKHNGLLNKPNSNQYIDEVYGYVLQLSRKMLSLKNPVYTISDSNSRTNDREQIIEPVETESDIDINEISATQSQIKELDFEEMFLSIMEKLLYLLLCVKGPETYSCDENLLSDDEAESEKPYVEFYKTQSSTKHFKAFREICTSALCFVCDEPIEKQSLIGGKKCYEGWCTDLECIQVCLEFHSARAEMRLTSLIQIYLLLSSTHKQMSSPTLISCLHQQLLCGCFGLINLKTSDSCTQLHHYTEGIQASSQHLQFRIREVVHDIYTVLVSSLKENQQLQLLTVFVLSARYKADDLSLVINNGLLNILIDIAKKNTTFIIPSSLLNEKIPHQAVAALRLLNIIAMSASIYSRQLDETVIQHLMDILHEQLNSLLDIMLSPTKIVNDGKLLSYERNLGDFLVFIHYLASSKIIQKSLCCKKWTRSLLSITGNQENAMNLKIQSLRPKLLALQLLGTILPSLKSNLISKEQREMIIEEIFSQLAADMWQVPYLIAERKAKEKQFALQQTLSKLNNSEDITNTSIPDDNIMIPDVGFDSEKCLCCSVEGNLTLVHGVGGNGYGLGNKLITSGCYEWKFLIVKENKGNEGTCVGVSRYPIKDYRHRFTTDMWLYRAYSGSLYHNGEKELCFQSFTQGDYITVVLDMDVKTLSFGKNGEEPRVAFEDIDATELYPCVLFYGTGPGEKVKMTDFQVHGSPRDLLPGDPNCSPMSAVLAESHITLLRKMHATDSWGKQINDCIIDRLSSTKDIFDKLEYEAKRKDPNISDDEIDLKNEMIQTELDTEKLCNIVWPALAVISGVDRGLRIGGQCIHKISGKRGIVLGTLKKGLTTVKVQWESEGNTADVPIITLQPLEAIPFSISKLSGITAEVLQNITKLSGITGEVSFPQFDLTSHEQKLLNPKEKRLDKRRHSWYSCDNSYTKSDIKNSDQEMSAPKPSITRTMESLTNEMVSDIMGEVTRLTTEKPVAQTTFQSKDEQNKKTEEKNRLESKLIETKLLNYELISLRLAFLQFAALKTIYIFVTSSKYAELLLVPEAYASGNKDIKIDGVCDKELSDIYDDAELKEALKYLMQCIVNKSTEVCKMKSVVNMAELERAETVLHSVYTKAKSEDGLELDEIKNKIDKILDVQNVQNKQSEGKTPARTHISNMSTSSSSSVVTGPFRVSRGVTAVPPATLTFSSVPFTSRSIYSDPATPQTITTALSFPSNTSRTQEINFMARFAPNQAFSPNQPLPPIAYPLLEMGFTSQQILQAIAANSLSGELSTHTVNFLATWMLENPSTENGQELETSGSVASAPASATRPTSTFPEVSSF